MKRFKRVLAAVLIVAVLFAMLFSAAFIVSRSNHDCHGHRCPVCVCISLCRTTLDLLSLALAVFVLFRIIFCICVPAFSQPSYKHFFRTLVNMKVKLTD